MPTDPPSTIPETSVAEAHRRPEGTVLLDVREIDEWAAGHAPGARNVPLSGFRTDAVPAGTTVLCICRSGNRSARAVAALRGAGIDATNVAGGMGAWEAAGLPVVRDDGGRGIVL